MADLITRLELEARVGHTFTGTLITQAEAQIEDATALVRLEADPVVVPDPPDVPAAIVVVMMTAVRRAQQNPLARAGEAIDGYQWQEGGATGVFLTDDEKKVVRRAVGKLGVGTLQLEGDLPLPRRLFADDTFQDIFGEDP